MKLLQFRSLTPFVWLVLCLCASAHAQILTGLIQGRVEDKSSAAAVEGARIVLEDPDGHELLQSASDKSGDFLFLGLPVSHYVVTISKEGYAEYKVRSLRVEGGAVSRLTVEMEKSKSNLQLTVILAWPGEPSEPWASDQGTRFTRERMDSLPGAANIWYLLQNQDISSVTNHIDEGGIQSGILPLVGVHGGTWTQNTYRWDGLNVTDPYNPGKPLTYPALETLEEFRVSGAAHSAAVPAPGAEFEMTSRAGSRTLHGQAEVYYLGDPLQSTNLDDRLRGFGFSTTPHFRQFPQGDFSAGGPVPGARAWSFFASLGVQHLSKVLPDFAAQPATAIYSGLLRLDRAPAPRDRLSMLVSGQIVRNSNLDAAAGLDPSATLKGNDRYELIQGHWVHRRSPGFVWDLRFGFSHASPTDTLQAGVTKPAAIRLFTGETTGAAPVESDSALSRFSLQGQAQIFTSASGRGRHRLDFGFDLEESLATEEQRVFQGLNLFLFPGNSPSEVAEFDAPSHAMQRLRQLSFFAEDRLQIGERLFIRAGLNLDSSDASLPAQASGAGAFAPARQFGGMGSVVSWATLSPRIGLVTPLWERPGSMRFTAGYSRYYHILPAAYADYANPTALGGKLYFWNDRNGDGIFQPGEEGTLLRVFGGPYSSVDPDLKRPYTDEFQFGLEYTLGRRLQAGVSVLARDTRRLVHTVNTGVPFSAYTPVSRLDPGNDGIPGTADDRIVTVYNQDPRTLGQDQYLLTNPRGLNATSRGLEAILAGKPFERGFFSVSFAAYRSEGDGNPGNSEFENDPGVAGSLFDNPNTLINSRGRLFFDRAFMGKIAAYYQAPLGFHLGTAVSYFDGLPFGRELILPDLNQGPFFIMATPRGEPGGFRTQFNLDFDQRVEREFQFRGAQLSVMVDVFNLLNMNQNLREFDISGPTFSQRRPTEVQNPRAFRIGLRLEF